MDVGLGRALGRGRWSVEVLILVLVDVGLGPLWKHPELSLLHVLILVLVDVGLGLRQIGVCRNYGTLCLNPCFSGCWSRTVDA